MTERILQDFWILSKSGLTLFHRVLNEKMDDQLFGGIFYAVELFGKKLATGGLKSFEMNSKKFTLFKKNNLLFIASSSKEVKEDKVNAELEKISSAFFKEYSQIIDNWNGDLNKFSGFENKIKDSLEKRFEETFW